MSLNEKLVPENTLLTDLKEFPIKLVELSSLTSVDLERHVKEITELNMDVFVFVYDAEIRIKPLEEIDDGVWEEADRLAMLQNTEIPKDLDHAPFTGFVKLPEHEIALLKHNYTTELSRIWLDTDLQNFGKLTSPITIHRHDLFILPSDLKHFTSNPVSTPNARSLMVISSLIETEKNYAPAGPGTLPDFIEKQINEVSTLKKELKKSEQLLKKPYANSKASYLSLLGGLLAIYANKDEKQRERVRNSLINGEDNLHVDGLVGVIEKFISTTQKGHISSSGWNTIITDALKVAGFNRDGNSSI